MKQLLKRGLVCVVVVSALSLAGCGLIDSNSGGEGDDPPDDGGQTALEWTHPYHLA